MGKEISGSKGFFMTVAVLLALTMVVSYFGDSTGQAIYRSSRTRAPFYPYQDITSGPSSATSDAGSGGSGQLRTSKCSGQCVPACGEYMTCQPITHHSNTGRPYSICECTPLIGLVNTERFCGFNGDTDKGKILKSCIYPTSSYICPPGEFCLQNPTDDMGLCMCHRWGVSSTLEDLNY